MASLRFITPEFFRTLRIPLLQGRELAESDMASTPYVAIVSQSFVHKYWPGEVGIGRHFPFALHGRLIVGMVGNVRVRGLEQESEPQVYLPSVQGGDLPGYTPKDLAIRTSGTPETLAPAVQRIIRANRPDSWTPFIRRLATLARDRRSRRIGRHTLRHSEHGAASSRVRGCGGRTARRHTGVSSGPGNASAAGRSEAQRPGDFPGGSGALPGDDLIRQLAAGVARGARGSHIRIARGVTILRLRTTRIAIGASPEIALRPTS